MRIGAIQHRPVNPFLTTAGTTALLSIQPSQFQMQDAVRFSAKARVAKPLTPAEQLRAEIDEQPQRLREMLASFPAMFDGKRMPAADTTHLTVIGEGSSNNAVTMVQPYMTHWSGLPVQVLLPVQVEDAFRKTISAGKTAQDTFQGHAFAAVSQSGNTGSIRQAIAKLQGVYGFPDKGAPLMPFINNPNGILGQQYGNHVVLGAGEEKSIAATKSMTTSMLAMLLLSLKLGHARGHLTDDAARQKLNALKKVPTRLNALLASPELQPRLEAFVDKMKDTNQFVLLSKGPLADILPEAALKLMETSENVVHANNTESFKHGPKVILRGVNNQAPNTVYVVPPMLKKEDAGYFLPQDADQFFKDVYAHFYAGYDQPFDGKGQKAFDTSRVFFIRFENSPPIPDKLQEALNLPKDHVLTLPATRQVATGLESLFVGIGAFQRLSGALAEARKASPNNAALTKAVV